MMKASFSKYLEQIAPALRKLVEKLGPEYDYVSLLSTDCVGFRLNLSQRSKSLTNSTMTTERGSVVRVCRNGLYSEYAFNVMPLTHTQHDGAAASEASVGPSVSEVSAIQENDTPGAGTAARRGCLCFDADKLADDLKTALDQQLELLACTGAETYETAALPDEPIELFVEKETQVLPEESDLEVLVKNMTALSDEGMRTIPHALDCLVNASSTHVSKLFLTRNRTMKQSYVYTDGSVAAYAADAEGRTKYVRESLSGSGGPELLAGLKDKLALLPKMMEDVLAAEAVEPGEYEIITTPEVSGLIAHEAFGHGVEMDMFVKKRALGSDYIGKRVGSDRVTMHEGALCAEDCSSYAFDDEGVLAGDVTEIKDGILLGGICDALSAMRLGVSPTGNGKREKYSHKAYTRMTNTIFDSGEDTLDEMIASIDHGYLLSGIQSGMEDPKHWGIQCIIDRGYEIADGRLTGKVVSPVVMTGYVPDLLGSVSMVSNDREVFGSGFCGKGYKEFVKVSDGGPCLKMKARLG